MKIYLAARYSRAVEMQQVRDWLAERGHEVTSRWIDHHGGKYLGSFTVEQLNDDPEYCAHIARVDLNDLAAADVVISFTGRGGKGGRHVEFGLAVARGKRLIVVGPREHVFHTLSEVHHFETWVRLAEEIDGFGLLDADEVRVKKLTGTKSMEARLLHPSDEFDLLS